MKNSTRIASFFLLFMSAYSFAQLESTFDLSRSITLNHTSEQKIIPLTVKDDTSHINFEVNCELLYNEIGIEIIDPAGKVLGSFTIESQVVYDEKNKDAVNTRAYQETVTGQIIKVVKGTEGTFKIIITPKGKVSSKIEIKSKQYLKN